MTEIPLFTGKARLLWDRLSERERQAFLQRFHQLDAGTLSQDDACRELEAVIAQFARQHSSLTGKVESSSVCSFCGKGFLQADGMVKAKSGAVICKACVEKFRQ